MAEEYLSDVENSYWECMDEETKNLCEKTIEEVKKLMPEDSNVSLLSDIPEEISTKICEDEGVTINKDLIKQANTPMTLAKYLRLAVDMEEMCKRVESDLEKILDKKRFYCFASKNFDNLVVISKVTEVNSDEKPRSLSLKYKYNPEEDTIRYSLIGQSWNWEISKEILLAILNDEIPVTSTSNQKTAKIEQNNDVQLTFGDVVISIKRK